MSRHGGGRSAEPGFGARKAHSRRAARKSVLTSTKPDHVHSGLRAGPVPLRRWEHRPNGPCQYRSAPFLLSHRLRPVPMGEIDPGLRGCQGIVRTDKFVVPAEAGTQGQATEIPRFPLSRERREERASGDGSEFDYSLEGRDLSGPWAPAGACPWAARKRGPGGRCDERLERGIFMGGTEDTEPPPLPPPHAGEG